MPFCLGLLSDFVSSFTPWFHYSGWSSCIGLRKISQHQQCNICFEYSHFIHNGKATPAEKLDVARKWARHIEEQYRDRLVYYHCRFASRNMQSDIVTLIIDGLDKSKGTWPQWCWRASKDLGTFHRPSLTVTCCMAHGYSCQFFVTDRETTFTGASFQIECIIRALVPMKDDFFVLYFDLWFAKYSE